MPIAAKIMSVVRNGMFPAWRSNPSPVPPTPPVPKPYQPRRNWAPPELTLVVVSHGFEPLVDPGVHLAEVAGRDVGAHAEEHQAEHEIAQAPGRDPEQADEEDEEERGEADVPLQPDHGHRGAPGHEQGDQRARVEDEPVTEPGRRDGEHLLVLGEVRGEEDAQTGSWRTRSAETPAHRRAPTAGPR